MKKIYILLLISSLSFAQKMNYTAYSEFLSKHISFTGNVDYAKIKENQAQLTTIIQSFEKTSPEKIWEKNEKLAYWINAYNAYTLQLVVNYYPIKSTNEIKDIYKINFIEYKGIKISLDYVEHEILKSLEDPRYHFVINCAANGSPILNNEAIEPATIDRQMNNAARLFLNDGSKNLITESTANLSKIFDWYAGEFVTIKPFIEFVNQFSVNKVTEKTEIKFNEFNWSLNQ